MQFETVKLQPEWSGPSMDLYIYYRAECQHAEAVIKRVSALQAQLTQHCAATASLKRRPEAKNGRHTWMETYFNIPDDFDVLLKQALMQSELAALIDGERHVEYFLDVTPCA